MSTNKKRKEDEDNRYSYAKEYLKGYSAETNVTSLEELFAIKQIPDDDLYSVSSFCLQTVTTTTNALRYGIDIPEMTDEECIENLEKSKTMFEEYIFKNYKEARTYALNGRSARYNLCSLIHNIVCHLTYIQMTIDKNWLNQYHFDWISLAKQGLFMYRKKPILEYTQSEVYMSLVCIANRWYEIEYSDDIKNYIKWLEARVAHLMIGRHDDSVLDGQNKIHKFRTDPHPDPNRKHIREYTISDECLSDWATMLTLFKRSFYLRTFLSDKFVDIDPNKEWLGYILADLRKGVRKWALTEAQHMQGAKFKEDISKTIMNMVGLRPGEHEKYTRDNAGVSSSDPKTIIEHNRTPLQTFYVTMKFAQGGGLKMLQEGDPHVQNVVLAKIFHQYVTSRTDFTWWAFCLHTEFVIVEKEEFFLIQKEPMIIQQMGEYNVWYAKRMYRTKSMDLAIALWLLIMGEHRKYKYDTLHRSWDMNELRKLIEEWEQLAGIVKKNPNRQEDSDDESMDEQEESDDEEAARRMTSGKKNKNKQKTEEDPFYESINPLFV